MSDSAGLGALRQQRLYELFAQAMDLAAEERAAFCERECAGDPALAHDLGTLLDSAPRPGDSFLSKPLLSGDAITDLGEALELTTSVFVVDPETIGPYRVRERLGEGGMGVVYRAEQCEPVQREVALKVIRPGMDTERVVRRFALERQALAVMQHPGIARIHDAGTTSEGRPYFAMELVHGTPLHVFCSAERLSTPARLELFAQLCDAVHHAHQKGIVHRDLKPSNVIVTEREGRPQPVVIDFGIARAMTEDAGDRAQLTGRHERIGTLDYMAPEQAANVEGDIDIRVDIYALGVMLFELLTGERPYDDATPFENRTPHPPSTRIVRSAAATAAALDQATDVRALRRLLRGELDWITVKALEPERERRYASASELAADVRRYLDKEPVSAGPRSTTYRLRTFVRRHRAVVGVATAVTVLLGAGLFVTVRAMLEAREQRDLSAGKTAALQVAVDEAKRERANAEAVTDFMVGLLELTNPENGPNVDKRAMLDHAASRVAAVLKAQPRAEARARMEIGEAYATLAEPELACEHLLRAAALLESERSVDRMLLYEALWTSCWPLAAMGRTALAGSNRARCRALAIGLFMTGDAHPELARLLQGARRATDSAGVAAEVARARTYAERRLPADDPRWVVLADYLHEIMVMLQLRDEQQGAVGGIRLDWYDWVSTIYRDRLGLPESDTRFIMDELFRIEIVRRNGEFERAAELCEAAEARLLGVVAPTHVTWAILWLSHGLSLVESSVPASVDRGLELLDRVARVGTEERPFSYDRKFVLKSIVAAFERHRPGRRTEELRGMLRTALWTVPPAMGPLGDAEVAVGPDPLVAAMRACGPEGVPALLAQCPKTAAAGDRRAACFAMCLLRHLPSTWRDTDRGTKVSVLRYCASIGRQTGCAYLEQLASHKIAGALMRRGQFRDALSVMDETGVCTTGPNAQFRLAILATRRSECLGHLGAVHAVDAMQSAYADLVRTAGLAHARTAAAFFALHEYLLRSGQTDDAADLAAERLAGLRREWASPHDLHETVWQFVCRDHGDELAAELAVSAARDAVQRDPDRDWRYRLGLGAALYRAGEPRGALIALAEAARLRGMAGSDEAVALPAFEALAWTRLGRRREAAAAVERAESMRTTGTSNDASNDAITELIREARVVR